MKKICVVTGTRAEYGLLKPLLNRINEDGELELQLVACGMHLSPEFGLTYHEIEDDGFHIIDKNEMLLSSDTPNGITKSVGLATIGFADIFTRNDPDLIILLGDRYEILAAATAALIHRIPIAHIHGGELTEGAIDEAIRHSITKMSMLHFTSTEEYRKRVIQMGEQSDRVFNVGSLGVENIKKLKLLSKKELERSIDFSLDKPFIIVTYHPVTLENNSSERQFKNLLEALESVKSYKVIFTKANSDTDGRIINKLIDEYVEQNKNYAVGFTSLGIKRYLSAISYADMVIGNSSSGLLEVPSFHIPTINIGNRQQGRIKAKSVIDCKCEKIEIIQAVKRAEVMKTNVNMDLIVNPYEGKNTSKVILDVIKEYLNRKHSMVKIFYDIENA
ncbi:MAG: UDP-N-acetylglucosamine 2-epimerase (hydrolyzing) [Lachnospiraceae bacterium]|nr:MAG: UDP-N-acetylglucosamine 2-epimerase (hydrolyzing) [Lachnospiraceae bacterium]